MRGAMRRAVVMAGCGVVGTVSVMQAQSPDKRWHVVARSDSAYAVALDTTSILYREAAHVRAWITTAFSSFAAPRDPTSNKPFGWVTILADFDCQNRQLRKLRYASYDSSGAVMAKLDSAGLAKVETPPYDVAPNSLDEKELIGVCAYVKAHRPTKKGGAP